MTDTDMSDVGQILKLGGFTERTVSALELIGDALQTLAKVESERALREVEAHEKLKDMNERIRRGAEINRASDDKREQFSDKATDGWLRETEAALPKSRFQQRADAQSGSASEAPKKQ